MGWLEWWWEGASLSMHRADPWWSVWVKRCTCIFHSLYPPPPPPWTNDQIYSTDEIIRHNTSSECTRAVFLDSLNTSRVTLKAFWGFCRSDFPLHFDVKVLTEAPFLPERETESGRSEKTMMISPDDKHCGRKQGPLPAGDFLCVYVFVIIITALLALTCVRPYITKILLI